MTPIEEKSLVQWILDLESVGMPPHYQHVRDMANDILAARGNKPTNGIGANWIPRFLKRSGVLSSRLAKPRECNRRCSENPEKFTNWFDRVKRTIDDFGIEKENIYNFDAAGFAMGNLEETPVIIGTEVRENTDTLQSGKQEWVTLIECISASGVLLPPLVIFKGKNVKEFSLGFLDEVGESIWQISVSEDGWINKELVLTWLKRVFIPSVINKSIGKGTSCYLTVMETI